jgi:uncharacterized YigZ family protein
MHYPMLSDDSYRTITGLSQGVYKEKGSKFIALAVPVYSEEEVKSKLAGWRKEYHDARHHCYAYRLGLDNPVYRVNDDGEPSGSSGKPIYGQILSMNLTNILIVVVRYFGGTKLGIPGLINAYRTAARDALERATIVVKNITENYAIRYNYEEMNDVMRILKEEGADILRQDFNNTCGIQFSIRRNSGKKLSERLKKINGLSIELNGVY